MIGGGIAGLAGCLYTLWGAFISPTIFGLATSAQIIIWVMIGGLGTLIGPVLGAIAIQWLVTAIGGQQVLDANLVLGIILLVFVLLMPAGVVPVVERLGLRASGAGAGNRADEDSWPPPRGGGGISRRRAARRRAGARGGHERRPSLCSRPRA